MDKAHYAGLAKKLQDNALFAGYAPRENPQIAFAVVAENAGFGASSAAPIARKLCQDLVHRPHEETPAAPRRQAARRLPAGSRGGRRRPAPMRERLRFLDTRLLLPMAAAGGHGHPDGVFRRPGHQPVHPVAQADPLDPPGLPGPGRGGRRQPPAHLPQRPAPVHPGHPQPGGGAGGGPPHRRRPALAGDRAHDLAALGADEVDHPAVRHPPARHPAGAGRDTWDLVGASAWCSSPCCWCSSSRTWAWPSASCPSC